MTTNTTCPWCINPDDDGMGTDVADLCRTHALEYDGTIPWQERDEAADLAWLS